MNINQIHDKYWFHEGAIKSFYLDIQNNSAEIELIVRKFARVKINGPITLLDHCNLLITFHDLIEASLFDKLPTTGFYLDYLFTQFNDADIEMAFNVHDNSSETYEKPNWVIKAKSLTWTEV